MTEKISIIVPCYNAKNYIRTTLNSLFALATSKYEIQIIVVDDASTDGTDLKILDQIDFAQEYLPGSLTIEYYRFSNNTPGGVSCAANYGISKATGDYLTFLDADDWIQPGEFLRAADYAFAGGYDFVINQCLDYKVDGAKRSVHPDIARFEKLRGVSDMTTLKKQLMRVAAMPWRKFYRRDFLESNELRFPEVDYAYEDNPFHWRVVAAAEKIGITEYETHCYRLGHTGQSVSGSGLKFLRMLDHFDTMEADLKSRKVEGTFEDELVAWVVDHILWCGEHLEHHEQPLLYAKANTLLKDFSIDAISRELKEFSSKWVTNRILSIYYNDIRWYMELKG